MCLHAGLQDLEPLVRGCPDGGLWLQHFAVSPGSAQVSTTEPGELSLPCYLLLSEVAPVGFPRVAPCELGKH